MPATTTAVPASADELAEALAADRAAVVDHPVYAALADTRALEVFCSHHVFAVWDFMALATRLQLELTSVTVPWLPSRWPADVVRMVNEVKLDEESDEHPDGGAVSHFDLYRQAMHKLGFSTLTVDKAVGYALAGDKDAVTACRRAGAPAPAVEFVSTTMMQASHEDLEVPAAAFAFGRETLIPAMFARVEGIDAKSGRLFLAYLERHGALDARRKLWDGVLDAINNGGGDDA